MRLGDDLGHGLAGADASCTGKDLRRFLMLRLQAHAVLGDL
jgi:hypothetical protein